ncbi:MAG: hypothetical protein R2727_02690 [Bacteroidales bacterium]
MKRLIISIIIVFPFLFATAQEGSVKIVDSRSKEVIPYAIVCFQEIGSGKTHFEITGNDGKSDQPIFRKVCGSDFIYGL